MQVHLDRVDKVQWNLLGQRETVSPTVSASIWGSVRWPMCSYASWISHFMGVRYGTESKNGMLGPNGGSGGSLLSVLKDVGDWAGSLSDIAGYIFPTGIRPLQVGRRGTALEGMFGSADSQPWTAEYSIAHLVGRDATSRLDIPMPSCDQYSSCHS